jgi:uncharacterized protein GlcG (DUF336 family)
MPAHESVALTLSDARTIVEAALEHAHSGQYPPMTVAVLDAAGHLVAFARADGSSLLRGRIARAKARGALNMGVGSRSLAARAAAHPAFINSVVALADGDLVPSAGCSCATTTTTASARSGSARVLARRRILRNPRPRRRGAAR